MVNWVAGTSVNFASGIFDLFHALSDPLDFIVRQIREDLNLAKIRDEARRFCGALQFAHFYTVVKYWWTNCTAFAPSPTPEATRLMER